MNIAGICPYETPCGWCSKWDKKCDKKIGCADEKPQRGLRANTVILDDMPTSIHIGWDYEHCATCDSYEQCVDCIKNHPELVVKCILFGSLTKYIEENMSKESNHV